MKKSHFFWVLALFIGFAGIISASYAAEPQHGFAMHGDLKYGPDFTHFDYVNPDAPKGGTLRSHAIGTFDSLNPFIIKGTSAAGLTFLGQSLIYDSLMEQSHDEPFSMYGLIAESVERPEDNLSVTFNLNPKASWHDGTPITADDVIWTFNTLLEHGAPFFKAYYGDVAEVVAEAPRRVTFKFKSGDNAELPLILAQMPVLPKAYWETEGADFTQTSLTPPLGSGPYKITDVDAGRRIVYSRVKDYWAKDLPINRGRFNFDQISYDYYRDGNVALEAFLAGEYDIREENIAKLWATAYDSPAIKSGDIVMDEIAHNRPQGMQGFIYNIRRPIFADPAVREALAYAFDFEWSNNQFAYGSYKRSTSYFSNSELAASGLPEGRELEILDAFRDQLPPRLFTEIYTPPQTDGKGNPRRNLRKAAQLLEQAGYKTGKDGIRTHAETGVRLEFEIVDNNPAFERWVLPFIRNLERIGVQATFRVIDPAQYQNRVTSFDYDMTILSLPQSSSPGNEQRDYWSSVKADQEGSRNYIGISDPVIDALIESVIQAPSREELVARTHALDRVLLWNFYVIPQWHIDNWRLAWAKKLQKPETLSDITPGITDTWWVEE